MADVTTVKAEGATTPALPPTQSKASIVSSVPRVIRSIFGKEQPVPPSATTVATTAPSQEPTKPSRPLTRVERVRQSVQAGGAFIYRNVGKHPIAFTLICSAIVGIAAKIFLTHRASTQAAQLAALNDHLRENSASIDLLACDEMFSQQNNAMKTPTVSPCCKGPTAHWKALQEKADLREFHDQIAFEFAWKENVFGQGKDTLNNLTDGTLRFINPKAYESVNGPTDDAASWSNVIEGSSTESIHKIAGQLEDRAVGHLKIWGDFFQAEEAFQVDDRFAPSQPLPEGDIRGERGYNFPGTNTPVKKHVAYLRSLTPPRVEGEGADLRLTFNPEAAEGVVRPVAAPETLTLGDRNEATKTAGKLFGNLKTIGDWFQFQTDDRFDPEQPLPQGDIRGERGYNFPGTNTPVKKHVAYLRSLTPPRVEGEGADLGLTFDPEAVEGVVRPIAAPETHSLGDRNESTTIASKLFGNLKTIGDWFQFQTDDRFDPEQPLPEGDIRGERGYNFPGTNTPVKKHVAHLRSLTPPRVEGERADLRLTFDPEAAEGVVRPIAAPETLTLGDRNEATTIASKLFGNLKTIGDWFQFETDDRFAPSQPLPQGDIRGEKGYNFPGTNTPVKQHVAHLRSLTPPRVEGERADLRLTFNPEAVEGVVSPIAEPETLTLGDRNESTTIAGKLFGNLKTIGNWFQFETDDRFAPSQPLPQGDIRGEKGYNFPGTNTPVKQHVARLRSLTPPRVEGERADLRLTHEPEATEGVARSASLPETQQRRIKPV